MRLGDLDALFCQFWGKADPFKEQTLVRPCAVWSDAATMAREAPTIDPETLPVVRELREELARVTAERNVTQALFAEYSGVIGMERVRYIFGHPLDKALNLLMADREGRCVVIPEGGFADKDGEQALKAALYVCSVENSASTRYTACAIAEKLLRDAGKHT